MMEQTWLTRYQKKEEIAFDAGPEFKAEFKELIQKEYHFKARPVSVRNPQSNATMEQIHGTIVNVMQTIDMSNISETQDNPFARIVSAVCWTVQSTYHTMLKGTLGQ